MAKIDKTYERVISGLSDNNIRFTELVTLLKKFGFNLRIKGDHFIFYKRGVEEIINIQPIRDKAKPYQIKQIRNIIFKYKLKPLI